MFTIKTTVQVLINTFYQPLHDHDHDQWEGVYSNQETATQPDTPGNPKHPVTKNYCVTRVTVWKCLESSAYLISAVSS